jgi:hypothetical protein
MPTWGFVLMGAFLLLGLRARPKWNVNVIAVAVTIIVVGVVAVQQRLI